MEQTRKKAGPRPGPNRIRCFDDRRGSSCQLCRNVGAADQGRVGYCPYPALRRGGVRPVHAWVDDRRPGGQIRSFRARQGYSQFPPEVPRRRGRSQHPPNHRPGPGSGTAPEHRGGSGALHQRTRAGRRLPGQAQAYRYASVAGARHADDRPDYDHPGRRQGPQGHEV